MIRYVDGNLLTADAEALVNTVNTVGVMGKGIALQFKEQFKENFAAYVRAFRNGELRIGKMLVTETGRDAGPRWIVNFPTKQHWRQPSKLEYVESGLEDLVREVRARGIRSIAVPALGCGNGGLDWEDVRHAIERAFEDVEEVEVFVFAPTDTYHAAPKRSGVEGLTMPRALLVDLVRKYLVLGLDCTHVEVQKLAYVLHRISDGLGVEDVMGLRFQPGRYGPYADNLRHLVDHLDGSYLRLPKRAADASAFDSVELDASRLGEVEAFLASDAATPFRPVLARVDELIDGFQSPFLMELLATVDWILAERDHDIDTPTIIAALGEWPAGPSAAARKLGLFDERVVDLARERLMRHADVLYRDTTRSREVESVSAL